MNAAPQHHYAMQAALAALDQWVRTGKAPPKGVRLATNATTPATMVLDANGNATGGVRSPWMDAPTSKLSGLGQSGGGFAVLFGTTELFDKAKLAQLYPGGKADYLKQVDASISREVKGGFMLKSDAAEVRALAAASYPE